MKGSDYCPLPKHRDQRILTPEEAADKATALSIVDLLEAELKLRILEHRAVACMNKMRRGLADQSDLLTLLVRVAGRPEAEKTETIKGWASWLEEGWNRRIAPYKSPDSETGETLTFSARDYFLPQSEEYIILMRSLCDGASVNQWNTNHQAQTRTYVLPDMNHHFVQLALTDQDRAEGAGVEMLERLTLAQDADAVFAMLYVSRLLAPPAPLPPNAAPVGWIDLDDVMEKIGWIPHSTKERQTMRGRIWDYLCYCARAGVYAKRTGVYLDPDTGELIPTQVDGPIWSFHDRERPIQPSLIQTLEVPLRVEIVMTRTWTRLVTDPITAQYFPLGERLGSIPGNQPSGAWARCIGMALANLWWSQPKLTLLGEIRPTRRSLLTRYTPKKAPPMEVLASLNPQRAKEYERQALKTLVAIGFLAPNAETEMHDDVWKAKDAFLPRKEWQEEWMEERLLPQPGPAMYQAVVDAANALLPPIPSPLTLVKRGPGRPRKIKEN